MSWCPVCKYEFREGFTICKDCNENLVDKLIIKPDENINEERKIDSTQYFGEEVYLTNVDDEYTVSLIRKYFEEEEIPVVTKQRGTGNAHSVYLGIEVYVPMDKLEKAKIILNEIDIKGNLDAENDDHSCEEHVQSSSILKRIIWILLIGSILFIYFLWMFQKVTN